MKVELTWDERQRIAALALNDIESIECEKVHYFDNDQALKIDRQILRKVSGD